MKCEQAYQAAGLHRTTFGAVYDWSGEFHTINMTEVEAVSGGDIVFTKHAAHMPNPLVWCTQGICSKFEYLEQIYSDAAGCRTKSPKQL